MLVVASVWFKRRAIVVKYSFSLHATSCESVVSLLSNLRESGKTLPVPVLLFFLQSVFVAKWFGCIYGP